MERDHVSPIDLPNPAILEILYMQRGPIYTRIRGGAVLIICMICKKELKKITTFHLNKHGHTTEDYRAMFPDADMVCADTRKRMSEGLTGRVCWCKGKKRPEHSKMLRGRPQLKNRGKLPPNKGNTNIQTYGKERAEEIRRKLVQGQIRRWKRPVEHEKASRGQFQRFEDPEKYAQYMKNRKRGREHWSYGKPPTVNKRKRFRTLKGHYVRSTWERTVCDWLYRHECEYFYEPVTFEFDDVLYTPDMYLPHCDLWIEVKGWWDDYSIIRSEIFKQHFPNYMEIDKRNIEWFREAIT